MGRRLSLVLLTIFLLASTSPMGASVPTCDEVVSDLVPCVPYLAKAQSDPPKDCCRGVKNLNQYGNQKSARQAICQCLESVTPWYPNIDHTLLGQLPRTCGVNQELPSVSPDFDCTKA